jgi:hypothetical protein
MARRAKLGSVTLALGAVAATALPLAPATAENVTAAASKPDPGATAELKPVGGSGLRGLAVAREHKGKLRFHATLACSQACPTGATANGVRVRFRLTRGSCGDPPGKTFSVGGGKLGPGGLDVKRARDFIISPEYRAVRAVWDPGNDGRFERAACAAFVLMQYFGY